MREEQAQKLSFAYGSLACSTNHKPKRKAFRHVAIEIVGITEAEFELWAKDKEWFDDKESIETSRGSQCGVHRFANQESTFCISCALNRAQDRVACVEREGYERGLRTAMWVIYSKEPGSSAIRIIEELLKDMTERKS